MKKLFPFVLLVLMAFAGCQRGPVMYEMSDSPRDFVGHVEKFVKQTEKSSKHYSAEDWQVAVEQFVVMSKDYVEKQYLLTADEKMRFDNARVKFMGAIDANGTPEIAKQVKEAYNLLVP